MKQHVLGVPGAIAAGCALGVGLGAFNGLVVTVGRVPLRRCRVRWTRVWVRGPMARIGCSALFLFLVFRMLIGPWS